MFHAIAERKVRQMFESLSAGNYEGALEGHAREFEHIFAGDHALGGTRYTAAGLRAWFERLYRLFPNLNFEVNSIAVSGPPWDMTIVAEWIDRAVPAGGGTYENRGVHVVRLTWGKLASLHAYLDTQILIDTLRVMAANGLEEATAAPIGDPGDGRTTDRQARRPDTAVAKSDDVRVSKIAVASAPSRAGSLAVGALATGAMAIGALAIGRFAIGKLTIRRARISKLEIDQLVVRRFNMPRDRAARLGSP